MTRLLEDLPVGEILSLIRFHSILVIISVVAPSSMTNGFFQLLIASNGEYFYIIIKATSS